MRLEVFAARNRISELKARHRLHETAVTDDSIITHIKDLDGMKSLLLIEAGSSEALLGACQFLTDPVRMQELQRRIEQKDAQRVPAFQVILGSVCRAQVPLETTYVTQRRSRLFPLINSQRIN